MSARSFQLTPPRAGEHQAQIECTEMLKRVLRPEVCWTAIDHGHSFNPTLGRNGRPIGLMEAAKRKARGVRAGICDYLFWDAGQGYAIEFKDIDGVLSDDQKIWLKEMIRAEVHVGVCWSIVAVFDKVHAWGLTRQLKVAAE